MAKRDLLTRVLAITGSVLVWFPVLAPLVFAIPHFIRSGRFQVDYLMPAELGPVVILGAALLLWAAIRGRAFIKWVAWSIVLGILCVVAGQVIAVLTGLASGETEMGGWQWVLVLAMIIGYILAIISLGVGGVRLIRVAFQKSEKPA